MITENLKRMQALPLSEKVDLSKSLIRDWYEHFNGRVAVSYSGGKDSTVLLHLVRQLYPEVPAVYCDTGLEFPEVKEHVKATENVITLKPELNFRQVLDTYGVVFPSKDVAEKVYYAKKGSNWAVNFFNGLDADGNSDPVKADRYSKYKYLIDAPFKISDKCCDIMKERPISKFQKANRIMFYTGLMASESKRRAQTIRNYGCNADHLTSSKPLGFWNEQDILLYIYNHDLEIPSVYGDIVCKNGKLTTTGEKRTGCMFCLIGSHLEKPNRFQRMKDIHPARYKYCMEQLGLDRILTWLDVPH